jgi:hypothetical protein
VAPHYLILVAVSAAAGLALGRVISRRLRRFMLAGGFAAALLGLALTSLAARGLVRGSLSIDLMGFALFGTAAILLPFALGAAITGP